MCLQIILKATELYEVISMFHSLFEISFFLVLDVAFIYVQVKGPKVGKPDIEVRVLCSV